MSANDNDNLIRLNSVYGRPPLTPYSYNTLQNTSKKFIENTKPQELQHINVPDLGDYYK